MEERLPPKPAANLRPADAHWPTAQQEAFANLMPRIAGTIPPERDDIKPFLLSAKVFRNAARDTPGRFIREFWNREQAEEWVATLERENTFSHVRELGFLGLQSSALKNLYQKSVEETERRGVWIQGPPLPQPHQLQPLDLHVIRRIILRVEVLQHVTFYNVDCHAGIAALKDCKILILKTLKLVSFTEPTSEQLLEFTSWTCKVTQHLHFEIPESCAEFAFNMLQEIGSSLSHLGLSFYRTDEAPTPPELVLPPDIRLRIDKLKSIHLGVMPDWYLHQLLQYLPQSTLTNIEDLSTNYATFTHLILQKKYPNALLVPRHQPLQSLTLDYSNTCCIEHCGKHSYCLLLRNNPQSLKDRLKVAVKSVVAVPHTKVCLIERTWPFRVAQTGYLEWSKILIIDALKDLANGDRSVVYTRQRQMSMAWYETQNPDNSVKASFLTKEAALRMRDDLYLFVSGSKVEGTLKFSRFEKYRESVANLWSKEISVA